MESSKAIELARTSGKQVMTLEDAFEERQEKFVALAGNQINLERMFYLYQQSYEKLPALAKCTILSSIAALMKCAELRLAPNTLNLSWIIPFQQHAKKCTKQGKCSCPHIANWIPGYKGLQGLAQDAHGVTHFDVRAVYDREMQEGRFDVEEGTNPRIYHKPSMDLERGAIVAMYAIAWFGKDRYKFDWLPWGNEDDKTGTSDDTIMSIRNQSKSKITRGKEIFWTGPWRTHPKAMGLKSTARRLCWRGLSLNPESRLAKSLMYDSDEGPNMQVDDDIRRELGTGEEIPMSVRRDRTMVMVDAAVTDDVGNDDNAEVLEGEKVTIENLRGVIRNQVKWFKEHSADAHKACKDALAKFGIEVKSGKINYGDIQDEDRASSIIDVLDNLKQEKPWTKGDKT